MSSKPSQTFFVVDPSSKARVARIEVNATGFIVRELVGPHADEDPEFLEQLHSERDQHASFVRATDIHWRNRLKAPPGTFGAAGACLFTFETTNIVVGPLVLSIEFAAMLPPEEMADVTHFVSVTVFKSATPLAKIALNGHLPLGEKVGTRTLVVEHLAPQLQEVPLPPEVIVADA